MTAQPGGGDLDREATDRAAAAAVEQVRASFAVELAGRPLNAQQRALMRRAEALARHWTREAREGRPPVSRTLSSRDPVLVARAAKRLVQSGHWQQQIARDDRTKVLMSLKARLPFAVGKLPTDALVALTKAPPPGGCHWCAAFIQRAPDKPELERDDVTLALLGEGCQRCRTRWEAVAVAQREQVHTAQLVAAGFRPVAAGRLRTPEQIAAYTASLRSLATAKLPPAAASQPATTSRSRRVPDPPYFRRKARPWLT